VSGYQALRFERRGDVLRVEIDHPKSELNAVDALLHDELTRLFRELLREDEARAVLLTGRGPAFSAGGDFAWFPSLDDLAKLEHLRRDAKQMIWDLLDVQIPIVAAVNGPASWCREINTSEGDIRSSTGAAGWGVREKNAIARFYRGTPGRVRAVVDLRVRPPLTEAWMLLIGRPARPVEGPRNLHP
jgi:hypothetical protein